MPTHLRWRSRFNSSDGCCIPASDMAENAAIRQHRTETSVICFTSCSSVIPRCTTVSLSVITFQPPLWRQTVITPRLGGAWNHRGQITHNRVANAVGILRQLQQDNRYDSKTWNMFISSRTPEWFQFPRFFLNHGKKTSFTSTDNQRCVSHPAVSAINYHEANVK